jgi:hypothetical protein
MTFQIMSVRKTDDDPFTDREEAQQLADELNRDAINASDEARFIVVATVIVGDLFVTAH